MVLWELQGGSGVHCGWWVSEERLNKLSKVEMYIILAADRCKKEKTGQRPHFLKPQNLCWDSRVKSTSEKYPNTSITTLGRRQTGEWSGVVLEWDLDEGYKQD